MHTKLLLKIYLIQKHNYIFFLQTSTFFFSFSLLPLHFSIFHKFPGSHNGRKINIIMATQKKKKKLNKETENKSANVDRNRFPYTISKHKCVKLSATLFIFISSAQKNYFYTRRRNNVKQTKNTIN